MEKSKSNDNYNIIKKIIFLRILVLLQFVTISCDRPVCKNTNPTFDKYLPETNEYKSELAKQLKIIDQSKLTFWVDKYVVQNNSKYLYANIQSDELCAIIVLSIKNSTDGIQGIIEHEGGGYTGAELKNLKFLNYQDKMKTEFIFKSVTGVKD